MSWYKPLPNSANTFTFNLHHSPWNMGRFLLSVFQLSSEAKKNSGAYLRRLTYPQPGSALSARRPLPPAEKSLGRRSESENLFEKSCWHAMFPPPVAAEGSIEKTLRGIWHVVPGLRAIGTIMSYLLKSKGGRWDLP